MKKILITCLLTWGLCTAFAQAPPKPYGALPAKRQLDWQETGMYCIIHFSMATFTDKEWGFGDEDPKIFNPANFDAMQIVSAAKAGGFKGIIVVAKHHDGFCLWPTKTTQHNIANSPWENGKGDLVKEYQIACQKLGMKMGIYCSPWDRNNPLYGTPAYVTQIYRKQLEELYANYGKLFMSWHDGANGGDGYYGGAREVRKIDRSNYYGWDTTWAITRRMQPDADIFGDIGPDVRWVGNEEGHAGETCWATYTPEAPEPGKKPANGYNAYWKATEGTRNGEFWMPAECDVPMRAGWFYHKAQDGQTKSPYQLLDLYYQSVGRGACLDLGLSPTSNGQLTSEDIAALKGFGNLLKQTFTINLAANAKFTASNVRGNNAAKYGPAFLTDNNRYSYWATDDKVTTPQLVANLDKPTTFNVIRLRENIKLGQRISGFTLEAWQSGNWHKIASGTSIGANRLIRLQQNVTANKVRLIITESGACVALSDFGLFKEPIHLVAPAVTRDKAGNVNITSEAPVEAIHYTLDGSEPNFQSPIYTGPVAFSDGGIVKARSFEVNNKGSEVTVKEFGLCKAGWKILAQPAQGENKGRQENAIDDNDKTVWFTLSRDSAAVGQFPQEISIDLGKSVNLKAFTYLPRQDKKTEGIADRYVFYTSNDGSTWNKEAEGEFANIKSNPLEQVVALNKPVLARYIRFSVLHVVTGNGVAIAEIGVRTEKT